MEKRGVGPSAAMAMSVTYSMVLAPAALAGEPAAVCCVVDQQIRAANEIHVLDIASASAAALRGLDVCGS